MEQGDGFGSISFITFDEDALHCGVLVVPANGGWDGSPRDAEGDIEAFLFGCFLERFHQLITMSDKSRRSHKISQFYWVPYPLGFEIGDGSGILVTPIVRYICDEFEKFDGIVHDRVDTETICAASGWCKWKIPENVLLEITDGVFG